MRNGHHRESHHGERRRGREGGPSRGGAKTFRRGRAIAFLETLQVKRATVAAQLEKPEFQSIKPVLVGELKAIDGIIDEFKNLFEIREGETSEEKQTDATEGDAQNEEH